MPGGSDEDWKDDGACSRFARRRVPRAAATYCDRHSGLNGERARDGNVHCAATCSLCIHTLMHTRTTCIFDPICAQLYALMSGALSTCVFAIKYLTHGMKTAQVIRTACNKSARTL